MKDILKLSGGPMAAVKSVTHLVVLVGIPLALLAALAIGVAAYLHRWQTRRDVIMPGAYAVVGRMGAGKTLFTTWAAAQGMKRGRTIFANYHLRGAVDWDEWEAAGRPEGAVVFLENWAQVVAVPRCTNCVGAHRPATCNGPMVLVDEVQIWWPSHASKVPAPLAGWVAQIRKRGITFMWTTQDWDFVGKRLRRLAFAVWEGAPRGPSAMYTLYPITGYNQGYVSRPKRIARMVMKKSPKITALYDTQEVVRALDGFGDMGAGQAGPGFMAPGAGDGETESERLAEVVSLIS